MSKVESESMIGVSRAGEALLPWESLTDYRALRDAFWRDHGPRGATEQALVARLVWIEWRRRRLALAERAAHMAALAERIGAAARTLERAGVRDSAVRERLDLKEIVESDASGDATKAKRHATDCEATARALALLKRNGADAYARAVAALHEDTRAWWDDGWPAIMATSATGRRQRSVWRRSYERMWNRRTRRLRRATLFDPRCVCWRSGKVSIPTGSSG